MKEIPKEEIITILKEMRNACAACFRVVHDGKLSLQLEKELNKSKIQYGFGLRCQKLIDRLDRINK